MRSSAVLPEEQAWQSDGLLEQQFGRMQAVRVSP